MAGAPEDMLFEDESGKDALPQLDETAQRILNLLFVLNTAAAPLSTEQLLSDSDLGYGSGNRASDQRKFKRDRERLAEHGIIVREVRTRGMAETEESSWEIDRARTHAERDKLSADDAAVVLAAIDETFELHADNLERWPLQRAYLKLQELVGATGGSLNDRAAGDGYSPVLQIIWDAFMERRPARFTYCDAKGTEKDREVEIYGTFAQGCRSYLVGFDRDAGGMRTFRTDRITKARHAPVSAGTYRIPAEFDVEDYQFLPFDFSDSAPVEATFRFPTEVGKHELALLTRGRGTLTCGGITDGSDTSDAARTCWIWTVPVRDLTAAATFALAHASLGMKPSRPVELVTIWREVIKKAVDAHASQQEVAEP